MATDRTRLAAVALSVAALVVAACGPAATPGPSGAPGPSATSGGEASV